VTKHGSITSIDSGGHRERVLARRDALVEGHLLLVHSIALGIHRNVPDCFELDDLIGIGNAALNTAATRYKPSEHGGVPFSAYARKVIRGAMLDTIRQRWDAEAATEPLEEMADTQIKVPIETVIDNGRLCQRVLEAVGNLRERERAVLLGYYSPSEPSLRAVGERIGVSARRAAQLHERAIDKLRKALRTA
jgi:RNA polymerase sigma factor (sigma-70 family)